MKKYMIGLTLAVGMFLLAACGGTNQKDSKKNELTIVTTFYPMYEFTKEVVGNEGNVVVDPIWD